MSFKDDWKLAAKWLLQCNCLPEHLKSQLAKDTLTLKTFGVELRNGVILCNLLNYLIPNSVNLSKISKHSKQSRVMSAYNVTMFQEACSLFELNEPIQLDPDKLYDLDLSQTLKVLSMLSISPPSIAKGFTGFYIDSEYSLRTDPTFSDPTFETDEDSPGSIYAPATFFLDSNTETHVYDKINEHYKSSTSKAQNFFDLSAQASIKKTDHILRELLLTEESYLNMLNSLQSDYLLPVSKVLNYENYKCIGINIEILVKFHNLLYFKLLGACEGGQGRTVRICNIFLSFKKQFVEKYNFYFENIDDALEKINALSASDSSFKKLLDEGQMGNSFSLTDLLVQPFQRMTKYHLFFKEIYAKSKVQSETKQLFKRTWDAMEEICKYLNQCKKDQDNIAKINFLTKTLQSFKLKTELNLKELGRFLKDESLRKMKTTHLQEKDNGKKIIFLFEKAIIIISKSFNSYSYIDTIPIDDYLLSDSLVISNMLFRNISLDSTTSSKASVNDTQSSAVSLHNPNNEKNYMFYFKSVDQRNEWKDLFNLAKPNDLTYNNHKFTLKNFERNIVECNLCNNFLNGIFFQGYKCEYCLYIVHRECLEKTNSCEASLTIYGNQVCCSNEPHENRKKKIIQNDKENQVIRMSRMLISPAAEINIYRAIQNSESSYENSSKNPMLHYKRDDLIYIEFHEDENWAVGYKLMFGLRKSMSVYTNTTFKQEGYVAKNCLKIVNPKTDLDMYSWYLECDKKLALLILERIQFLTNQESAFFMVRFRRESGYAISICFNRKMKHIKINSKNNEYTIDNYRYFVSIDELVNFFMTNSLFDYFSDINTCLGKPYREILPEPVYSVMSANDYIPSQDYLENKNQEILLKKGHVYFFLQEFEHWSYVFNTEGLLGYVPKELLIK